MTTIPRYPVFAINDTDLLNDQLIDMAFITGFCGLSDKWFYKLISEGKFPKPIKMGNRSRWLKSEFIAWFQERRNQSRAD